MCNDAQGFAAAQPGLPLLQSRLRGKLNIHMCAFFTGAAFESVDAAVHESVYGPSRPSIATQQLGRYWTHCGHRPRVGTDRQRRD
jgi:hypothetical protein